MFKKLIPVGVMLLGIASVSSYMMSSNHNLRHEVASFGQPPASKTTGLKTTHQNSPEILVAAENKSSFKVPSPSLLKLLIEVQTSKGQSGTQQKAPHASKPPQHSTVHSTVRSIPTKKVLYPVHKTAKPIVHVASRNSNVTSGQSSDLYWLSHIIHAEALDQPLNAQIAVGDVVLNRVHSGQYPNTVKGVVFQISGGHYQFTPVLNGFIYTQPDPVSIEAAKKVLQGVNLVPNAFVYYTPSKTPANSWVRKQPTITAIGAFVFAK